MFKSAAQVIGVFPARQSNFSSFMEESLPEHCTNEIPGHVVVMGPEYKLPKKIVETKPSISLHAPCFLKSFQKVSKKYRPTGNWHWYKTGQASGEQLSIQHSHEPPIFSARARDDSAVVTFLTDNIFPKFGELNDMSYEWYVLQQDAGSFREVFVLLCKMRCMIACMDVSWGLLCQASLRCCQIRPHMSPCRRLRDIGGPFSRNWPTPSTQDISWPMHPPLMKSPWSGFGRTSV